MNLNHDFFQVSKSSEDQKRERSSPKMKHFFPPNLGGDLRSDAHRSQFLGGDADVDHTQIIGEDISPPPGFRQPCVRLGFRRPSLLCLPAYLLNQLNPQRKIKIFCIKNINF